MLKKILAGLLFVALLIGIVVGLGFQDIRVQQKFFGPRYREIPLAVWQDWYRQDKDKEISPKNSVYENIILQVTGVAGSNQWKELSKENRLQILFSLKDEPSLEVRKSIVQRLKEMTATKETKDALKEFLQKDESPEVRADAARALGKIRPRDKDMVPFLMECFGDDHEAVRYVILESFRRLNPSAQKVMPKLLENLDSDRWQVRESTLSAMTIVAPNSDKTIEMLRKKLSDPNHHVRSQAATALGWIAGRAKPAVSELIPLLADKQTGVKIDAARTLGKIGPAANKAVPHLIPLVDSSNIYLQSVVMETLGRMGPEAKAAIPSLRKQLKNENEKVRNAAKAALRQIDR